MEAYITKNGRREPLFKIFYMRMRGEILKPYLNLELRAVLKGEAFAAEFIELAMQGMPTFEGIIDEISFESRGKTTLIEIKARSKLGAYLCDNEAEPSVLTTVTLEQLRLKYGQVYGVLGIDGSYTTSLSSYTIKKGQSHWDVLAGFMAAAYGKTLILRDDGFLSALEDGEKTEFLLSKNPDGGGLFFYKYKQVYEHFKRISRISSFNNLGEGTEYLSPSYGEISRRRILSEPSIWSLGGHKSPAEIMRKSMHDSFMIEVYLPGVHAPKFGSGISFADGFMAERELSLNAWEFLFDKTYISKFELRDSYFEG